MPTLFPHIGHGLYMYLWGYNLLLVCTIDNFFYLNLRLIFSYNKYISH